MGQKSQVNQGTALLSCSTRNRMERMLGNSPAHSGGAPRWLRARSANRIVHEFHAALLVAQAERHLEKKRCKVSAAA